MGVRNIQIALLILLAIAVHGQDNVVFFYNTQLDTCTYDGVTFELENMTAHGGLCAYDTVVHRMYSCWTGGVNCWAYPEVCGYGQNAPSNDQILCNLGDNDWCCSNAEQCANSPGQINVCATKFPDPIGNLTVADAVQAEYKALGITTVTSTLSAGQSLVSGSATAFSSTILATGTSTTSSSVASASKTQASTSAVAPAIAAPTAPTSDARSGLAGGAIAGIVIAVIAVIGIAAAVYWCMRKRRTRRRNQWSIPDVLGKTSEAPDTALYEAAGREKPVEIGGGEARHEMA